MVIAQEKIEEIKAANDIVDVISSYLQIHKRGKNYLARCPFHNEKTPSFNISPDKQMYYCFGCHVGGTVFTFLQQFEKISFVDAVQKLAERAGISLTVRTESDEKDLEKESLYYLNQVVAEYYHENLFKKSAGKYGLDYLHKRDLSDEIINKFMLGVSLKSWNGLVEYAKDRKLNFDNLLKLGLINTNNKGSYYDYFRGRAMYPIYTITGKIAGFGGRKLLEEDTAGKYVNSRDSLVYNKSRILYGLFQSKDSIRKNESAILVEGYMDYLSLYQGNFKNIMATSGTSLTSDQIKIISRYTKDILFLYDADLAGVKATLRGLDLLLENGMNVKVVELAEGEDPDSFLKKYGSDKLSNSIQNAVSFIEFMAKTYKKLGKLNSAKDLTDSTRELIRLIAKVKDNLKIEFYIKEISEKFGIYENNIRDEYERITKNFKKQQIIQNNIKVEKTEKSDPLPTNKVSIMFPPPEEQELIAIIIMEGKRIFDFVVENVAEDEIESPVTKNFFKLFHEVFSKNEKCNYEDLLNSVDDDIIKGEISGLVIRKKLVSYEELKTKYPNIDLDRTKWIKDVIKKIKIKKIDSNLVLIQRKIKQTNPQSDEYNLLLSEFKKLNETKMNWIKME